MTWSFGESIFNLDKSLFNWLQVNYSGQWLGDYLVYSGSVYFWVPVWTFVAILLVLARPERAAWNIFFGAGAFILSYQAAMIVGAIVKHPPPFEVVYAFSKFKMPAFQDEFMYSLPDWASAASCAVLAYSHRRLKSLGKKLPVALYVFLPIFFFSRVLPGYAFPFDVLMGFVLGMLVGWLCAKLAENFDKALGVRTEA